MRQDGDLPNHQLMASSTAYREAGWGLAQTSIDGRQQPIVRQDLDLPKHQLMAGSIAYCEAGLGFAQTSIDGRQYIVSRGRMGDAGLSVLADDAATP